MKLQPLLLFYIHIFLIESRSIYRPIDPLKPELNTYWETGNNQNEKYQLKFYCFEYYAIFRSYDHYHFMSNLLPQGKIKYRNDETNSVDGQTLDLMISEFIEELEAHKKFFKNFKILKRQDFNAREVSGNLVAAFKDYPFIIKLFIENPKSFLSPYSKGWQSALLYQMNGGINRYINGFLRIKNLNRTKEKVMKDKKWSKEILFHRKWFWIGKHPWFIVEGKNIGPSEAISNNIYNSNQQLKIKIPSVYCIVADKIDRKDEFHISNKKERTFALSLCNFLENGIDPHIDNFVIENKTNKVIIIDTEHFPSMVGLKKPLHVSNYLEWYAKLFYKGISDNFLRSKNFRRQLQSGPIPVLNGFHHEAI